MQEPTVSAAPRTQWLWIILGGIASSTMPWKYGLIATGVILLLYCLCHPLKWIRLQKSFIYIYAGLAIGVGVAFFIHYDMAAKTIPMLVVPLVVWIASSIIFHGLEDFYALYALPDTEQNEQNAAMPDTNQHGFSTPIGISAWSGDTEGKADDINADGYYMWWQFYVTGEIAMGGPSYGDAIFANHCAFSCVGPSIAISSNGRYAALTKPSRQEWGTLLVDLEQKVVYSANHNCNLWEIDHIDDTYIYGRYSPLTSNATLKVSIADFIQDTKHQNMVQDDGWWLIDDEDRTPLPQYPAVSCVSKNKLHKALFVPNLEPFRKNPFLRYAPPFYQLLINDVLQPDYQTQQTEAYWLDGKTDSEQARFLLLDTIIFDCMPRLTNEFCADSPVQHCLNWQQHVPHLHFDRYIGASHDPSRLVSGLESHLESDLVSRLERKNPGFAAFKFIKMLRDYDWDESVSSNRAYTFPIDSQHVDYWNVQHQKLNEVRNDMPQSLIVDVDLSLLTTHSIHDMPIFLTAPTQAAPNQTASTQAHTIKLINVSALQAQEKTTDYGRYCTTLPWGDVIEDLTAEFQWSSCGRYLALLKWAATPMLASQIMIIDFERQQIQALTEPYPLASFIWLDKDKLELTYQIDDKKFAHIMLFGDRYAEVVAQPPIKQCS